VLRGQVEVLGLTTIFGNVTTPKATANALHLCEMAARTDVPVAQARIRARQRPESALGSDSHGAVRRRARWGR
jgi:inosine-uridine nucleoside N-ribohydrolase